MVERLGMLITIAKISMSSNILHLDVSYDIHLTMSWIPDGNHGVSGHIYEIIDYYLLLTSVGMKVGILICEDIDWYTFKSMITTKYEIEESELVDIRKDIIFSNRPTCVRGKNILIVDGQLSRSIVRNGTILCFKNILTFRCSPHDTHYDLPYNNVILLQDNRVYDDNDNKVAIDYKKKILFSRYKKISRVGSDVSMLYLTSNCRKLDPIYLRDCLEINKANEYLILTNTPERYRDHINHIHVSYPDLPAPRLFNSFDTYIYTKTDAVLNPDCGCFDCSPRFIAECAHYNKKIIYHDIDNSYLQKDTGLKWRKHDIETDLDSINLKPGDLIVDIVRDIL